MNRRHFLELLGVGACMAGFGPMRVRAGVAETSEPSIGEIAGARGLWYGATPERDVTKEPEAYQTLFRRHCRLLVPGWLSWGWIAPTPDTYDFSREAGNLRFAAEARLPLTGAHLVWQHRVPAWFESISDASQAENAIRRHIAAMTSRFRHRCFSWNAVNEAIDPREGRPDGLRNNDPFMKALGPRYIDLAFHAAREGDPTAYLVYNDAKMEADSPVAEARRRALLKLIDGLLDRNVPIDAVGLQSHLDLADTFNEKLYRRFLRELAERKIKILLTELDVYDKTAPADINVRDQLVADRYAQFLDVALDEKQVIALINWGLSDRYTWLAPSYSPIYGRTDGLPCRPLPFDAEFRAKPAYRAIVNSIRHAPVRSLTPMRSA